DRGRPPAYSQRRVLRRAVAARAAGRSDYQHHRLGRLRVARDADGAGAESDHQLHPGELGEHSVAVGCVLEKYGDNYVLHAPPSWERAVEVEWEFKTDIFQARD